MTDISRRAILLGTAAVLGAQAVPAAPQPAVWGPGFVFSDADARDVAESLWREALEALQRDIAAAMESHGLPRPPVLVLVRHMMDTP